MLYCSDRQKGAKDPRALPVAANIAAGGIYLEYNGIFSGLYSRGPINRSKRCVACTYAFRNGNSEVFYAVEEAEIVIPLAVITSYALV